MKIRTNCEMCDPKTRQLQCVIVVTFLEKSSSRVDFSDKHFADGGFLSGGIEFL